MEGIKLKESWKDEYTSIDLLCNGGIDYSSLSCLSESDEIQFFDFIIEDINKNCTRKFFTEILAIIDGVLDASKKFSFEKEWRILRETICAIALEGLSETDFQDLQMILKIFILFSTPNIINTHIPYIRGSPSMTALHFAVQSCNIKAAEILLERGSDPYMCDSMSNEMPFYLNKIQSPTLKERMHALLYDPKYNKTSSNVSVSSIDPQETPQL